MTFKELNLCWAIIHALDEKGYQSPTTIQQQTIPHILSGKDIVASAGPGTGKTVSFCIPILQLLSLRKPAFGVRALILTPTRELAVQVFDNLTFYGKNLSLKSSVIYDGVPQFNQMKEVRTGADILVATPGRLQDLIDQQIPSLKNLEILVLDEADRMLDIGFIHSIKKLIKLMPSSRQNIFFSATMPAEVLDLMRTIAAAPVRISVESSAKVSIDQSVYHVSREDKRSLLKHVINKHQMNGVNYELPESAETYIHRIGRTGRAGRTGSALSFCDRKERGYLNNINRISIKNLAVAEHPFNYQ